MPKHFQVNDAYFENPQPKMATLEVWKLIHLIFVGFEQCNHVFFLMHQESCTKEIISKSLTLPETNSSPPENRPSQEETSICYVSFREGIHLRKWKFLLSWAVQGWWWGGGQGGLAKHLGFRFQVFELLPPKKGRRKVNFCRIHHGNFDISLLCILGVYLSGGWSL